MFGLLVTVLLLIIHQNECDMTAKAVMYGDNSMVSYGTLTFTQADANSPVHVSGTLTGLNSSSAHGFHIHVYPVTDGSPNCTAAGLHFNPYNVIHGPRSGNLTTRHVGDLGNITTDSTGTVVVNFDDWIIQLYNPTQSILGRTAIVHRVRDDGGQGGFTDSHTTGNAGARVLCGLVKSNGLNLKPIMSISLLIMIIILIEQIV